MFHDGVSVYPFQNHIIFKFVWIFVYEFHEHNGMQQTIIIIRYALYVMTTNGRYVAEQLLEFFSVFRVIGVVVIELVEVFDEDGLV